MPFWLLGTGQLFLCLLRYRCLPRLLGLANRLLLGRDRLAHDDVGAGRAGDRALDEQQVVLAVDPHDLQVAHGHAVAAHPSGGAHALDNARRERRRADRSWRAMEHRSVRGGPSTKVVALHDALKALAAADADDVDPLAVLEDTANEDLIARLERIAAARSELYFAPQAGRWNVARLLVVAADRLVHLRGPLFDEPELHGFIAVALRVFRLEHHARARLDDGRGRDGSIGREDLRHANL